MLMAYNMELALLLGIPTFQTPERLSAHLPAVPILSEEEFDTKKPCPYTKQWWNGDLKWLKAQRHWAENLAFNRDIPDHTAKAEAAQLSHEMAEAIQAAKEDH
ncbi:hypothetical protein C0989_012668 [Termitomyces sp. Mn162]|nr:hypothetical protein C0989_012668 [Termitomyces sp. Mn162]